MADADRDTPVLVGYGGGKGGGGGGLSEDPDNLKSRAYARVMLALAEGEIDGLGPAPRPTGKDSTKVLGDSPTAQPFRYVYFDGVPMQNSDGSTNFKGAQGYFTYGTQGQAQIPGFSHNEQETAVGVEVKQAAPITHAITDANIDRVRVTVSVHGLYQTHSDGRITGTSVELKVDVQSNNGGFVNVVDDTIKGKTTGKYQRAYNIPLTGSPPWKIRVSRVTADNSSGTMLSKTYWDSYTAIIDSKLRYPNTALAAINIDSSQFSHIPTMGFLMRLLRVRVPTNYDPVARSYAGSWDGTFKVAWTDNPAWCFYDLLTSTRYGLGKYLPEDQIDKWGLYSISQYCDQLVPDGQGGTEPRFTCNLYLQTRQEAYTVLTQFVSIFRAMLYWAGGALAVTQDAPSDPVALFTNANVVDGQFSYAGAPLNQRHTVALVTWNNPANQYKQQVEAVEDHDAILRYGVIQTEVVAVGCASQGQAQRVGRWLLYTERMESETCTFTVGLEGAIARPGQIIQVADANRGGERRGGRILNATATTVQLDAAVTLQPSVTYTLSVVAHGGGLVDATVQAVTSATITQTLTLTAALSTVPVAGAIWILASPNLEPQPFRVLSVAEADRNQFQITALTHNPDKYASIENDTLVTPAAISSFVEPLDAPQNLRAAEYINTTHADVMRSYIQIGWDSVRGAKRYLVTTQFADEAEETRYSDENAYAFISEETGECKITVAAINAGNVVGTAASYTLTTLHKSPIPPAPMSIFGLYGAPPGAPNLDIYNVMPDPVVYAKLGIQQYSGIFSYLAKTDQMVVMSHDVPTQIQPPGISTASLNPDRAAFNFAIANQYGNYSHAPNAVLSWGPTMQYKYPSAPVASAYYIFPKWTSAYICTTSSVENEVDLFVPFLNGLEYVQNGNPSSIDSIDVSTSGGTDYLQNTAISPTSTFGSPSATLHFASGVTNHLGATVNAPAVGQAVATTYHLTFHVTVPFVDSYTIPIDVIVTFARRDSSGQSQN